jgi:hypothetical protein
MCGPRGPSRRTHSGDRRNSYSAWRTPERANSVDKRAPNAGSGSCGPPRSDQEQPVGRHALDQLDRGEASCGLGGRPHGGPNVDLPGAPLVRSVEHARRTQKLWIVVIRRRLLDPHPLWFPVSGDVAMADGETDPAPDEERTDR